MRYQHDFEGPPRRARGNSGYGHDYASGSGYGGRSMRSYDGGFAAQPERHYARDFWWMGGRAMPPQRFGGRYDEAYRRLSANTHPRFSPAHGMQPGVGGGYGERQARIHAREDSRFGDWTRWF